MSDTLKAYKLRYKKVIEKAQRKFRYMRARNSQALEFQEAEATGGQFTLRNATDYGEVLAEVTRARNFLSANYKIPSEFIKDAKLRGAEYTDLFERGIPMAIKKGMPGYDDDTAKLMFSIYRRLTETAPLKEQTNNYWESNEFMAALYSVAIEDKYDEDFLMRVGHELIESSGASQRREELASDIPVFSELTNRGGKLWGK